MSADNLQQSILDAIQLLSSKTADSMSASITIKGEVVELLDSSTNQYSVSYGGTIYKDVYGMFGVSYTPSTIVYVLIPDRTDYSKPKFIIGAAFPTASMYVTEAEEDLYIPISSNLFGTLGDIELKSPIDENRNIPLNNQDFGQVFKDYLNTYNHFLFSAYIKTNIDAEHQQIGNYGLKLILPFVQNVDGLQVTKEYKMDVSNIPGNPYALTEFEKVDLYFEVEDTLTYDTTREPVLYAFVKDFGYHPIPDDPDVDIWIKDISCKMIDVLTPEQTTGYYATIIATEGNYFANQTYFKDKVLTPLLKVNGKETKLSGWQCYWFVEDSSITTTSENYDPLGGLGWKCLNDKQNVEINEEGRKTFQYVTNNYNLIVTFDDVTASLRYKCVLVKDDIITQGFIKITNLDSNIETQLVSSTGSNTFIEEIGNVRLIARIFYDGITNKKEETEDDIIQTLSTTWQRFDKNNNFIDNDFYTIIRENDVVTIDDKQYFETEISYPCSMLDKQNTIYCTFYKTTTTTQNIDMPIYDDEGVEIGVESQSVDNLFISNLGTEHILVNTTTEYTYTVSLSGGDVLYKYDADGDSPMVSNYDGPLSSRITTIDPVSYKIYKPDGSELTEEEYLYVGYRWSFPKPDHSMLKLELSEEQKAALPQDDDYYYIEGKGLSSINYSISNTYNKKKSNNTILFYAVFDNTAVETTTNIKFLKDGESGTNGTKYSAVIEYNGYGYGDRDPQGRIRKFQAVYYQPNEDALGIWYRYDLDSDSLVDFAQPTFTTLVYKDGELYNTNLTYSWKLFEPSSSKDSFTIIKSTDNNAILNINLTDNNETIWNETGQIIECAVTINNGDSGNRETLYTYYPLEVTKIKKLNQEGVTPIIPHLEGGYEEVVYASDGTNPKFDNSNDFHCTDSIYSLDGQDNYLSYKWDTTDNLNIINTDSSSAKISPKTSFQNGESKNYVKVTLELSNAKQEELQKAITAVKEKISDNNTILSYYNYNEDNKEDDKRSHKSNLYYINDFLNNVDTALDNYETNLDRVINMLTLRQKMLDKITELRKVLSDFYDYCKEKEVDTSKYNYTQIRTSKDTILTRAYRNVYLLGTSTTIKNIAQNSNLGNVTIDVPNSKEIDIIICNQIQIYIDEWNRLCTEYQQSHSQLTEIVEGSSDYVYQEKYEILKDTISELPSIVNTMNIHLTEQNNPERTKFIELKAEIKAVFDIFKNYTTGTLIGYSNYINDVLDKIENLLYTYNDEEQQKAFYDAKMEEINTELKEQSIQLEAYLAYKIDTDDVIVHVKPIILLYNRYEFANINGWDGNKLYIDKNNSQYLLAPQVGAGIKNSDNSFTGLVMGIRNFSNGNSDVGLYGFVKGVQSIFLDANTGKAEFGIEKEGQIKIIPGSDAIIQSGDYGSGKGLKIKFNKNPEIRFGSGNFIVSPQGHLTAKGGGQIGNWKIGNDNTLQSSNNAITLNATSEAIIFNSNNGKIYSSGHSSIDSPNNGFYLSSDGLSIGGNFSVDSEGKLIAKQITANEHGTIGGWTIDENKLKHGENVILNGADGTIKTGPTVLSADGVSSEGFKLTNNGFILTKGGITLGSQGVGSHNGISFSDSGTSISGTIYANAGNIGGCKISNGVLEVPFANVTGTLSAARIRLNDHEVTGTSGYIFNGEPTGYLESDGHTVHFSNISKCNILGYYQ